MKPDDDDVVPMVVCPHCEHLVPESNLALHQARCGGRKLPARDTNNHDESSSSDEDQIRDGPNEALHRGTRRNAPDDDDSEKRPFLPRARWEATSQQHRGRSGNEITIDSESDDEDYEEEDRYTSDSDDNEYSAPPVAAAAAAAAASSHDVIDLVEDDDAGKWSCPRCTLDNPVSSGVCEACSYHRPGSERPADPTRRERLIDGPQLGGGGFISSAALLGSLVGGTGAYMRGQPVSSGALNGALTGAVGGAVLSDLANAMQQQQQQQAMYAPSSPSRTTFSSFSMMRTPDGRFITSRSGNGAAGLNGNNATNSPSMDVHQQLLQLLQAHQLARGGAARMPQHANPDQMSYDQLLQMFGTGTENLGAAEGQIRSLPSSTIDDVDKLPPDSRQCSICLEEFKTGDKRKIMPCLHGFHADCVDKWLRTNGSCPICKHRLDRS